MMTQSLAIMHATAGRTHRRFVSVIEMIHVDVCVKNSCTITRYTSCNSVYYNLIRQMWHKFRHKLTTT